MELSLSRELLEFPFKEPSCPSHAKTPRRASRPNTPSHSKFAPIKMVVLGVLGAVFLLYRLCWQSQRE